MKSLVLLLALLGVAVTASAQDVVTLKGATYTTVAHPRVLLDGPTGTITSSLSRKAVPGNPPWDGLIYFVDQYADLYDNPTYYGWWPGLVEQFALAWYASADPVTSGVSPTQRAKYLTAAKYLLLNFDLQYPGTWCNEGTSYCGKPAQSDYSHIHMVTWGTAYSILRSQLTTEERQRALDLMLNGSNGESCRNDYPSQATWTPGSCGLAWNARHHNAVPPALGLGAGGSDAGGSYNLTATATMGYIAVGLALAEDTRGRWLLTNAYDYWYDNVFAWEKTYWTGFTQGGSFYQHARYQTYLPNTVWVLRNSLPTGPDWSGGVWLKRFLPYYVYNGLPGFPRYQVGWGQYDIAGYDMATGYMQGFWLLLRMYAGSVEANVANYWARNIWGDWNYLSLRTIGDYSLLGTDPLDTQTNVSTQPLFYVFKDTDRDATKQYAAMLSRSGWGTTDSLLAFYAMDMAGGDHLGTYGQPGGYVWVKGSTWYLGGDNSGTNTEYAEKANTIEVGGANNLWNNFGDPTNQDLDLAYSGGSADYAYAMAHMVNAYKPAAAVTRADRHIVHVTAGGDAVVVFDDVVTSSGKTKKAFVHYTNNGGTGEGTTTRSGDAVTSTNSGASVTLSSKVLLGYPTVDNVDGSYAGGAGSTFRLTVCAGTVSCDAANTSGEMLVAHQFAASNTSSLITGTTFQAALLPDLNPRSLVVFPRAGTTYTTYTVPVTGCTGTLKGVVTGLQSGDYSVVRDATTVATSVTVATTGTPLGFTSTTCAGTYVITRTGAASVPGQPGQPIVR